MRGAGRVAVAYSGGRDSTALLHATLAAARDAGLGVVALHVHHGLSAHADAWLAHCEAQCARWADDGHALAFDSRRLGSRPPRGASVEAWAREARYAALTEMAQSHRVDLVLLAQHRRDQAETVLLQALRGGGAAGLAAMPRLAVRHGLTWARPWLDVAPERIDAYARAHALRWVDDDSNRDPRLARNRLRLAVWPAMAAAFPAAEAALATVARRAAEALECADALAADDLARTASADALDLAAWARLGAARRGNALRAWLKARTGAAAPAALVERLQRELAASTAPARWAAPAGCELRRWRGALRCVPARGAVSPSTREARLGEVSADGVAELPGWGGRLRLERVAQQGVALDALAQLRLAPRTGGEAFQSSPGRPPRSLKKQFQAAGVPAWRRDGPLVYAGDALVYVPGLGHDARSWAAAGVEQAALHWEADPSAAG